MGDGDDEERHDSYDRDGLSCGEDSDGYSFSNDTSEMKDEEEYSNPLAQLESVLEKNGMLDSKLEFPTSTNGSTPVSPSEDGTSPDPFPPLGEDDVTGEVYRCHLCSYSGTSKFHFNCHMNTHFDHKCPFCDYTSRTEGRLKRHVKDFHSEVPPGSWSGQRIPRKDENSSDIDPNTPTRTSTGKVRHYRCKQCNFVSVTKTDFWEHSKTHIKSEKLLTCPKCPFVTEYKHHLEYHLRNHFGSKPFKCSKCNYSCVNKSMLNSHMKSHSNIYQYRCSDCSYATKYCHSLKLHLRKYTHKPATVLNLDGTPNPYPVIDVYGTRRGPRPKKQKIDDQHFPSSSQRPISSIAQIPPVVQPSHDMSQFIPSSLGLPFLYPPHVMSGPHSSIFIRPPSLLKALPPPPSGPLSNTTPSNRPETQGDNQSNTNIGSLKCNQCSFTTEIRDMFSKHLLLHVASENQDLCKLYGITSETILQMQDQQQQRSRWSADGNGSDQDASKNRSPRIESPRPWERKMMFYATESDKDFNIGISTYKTSPRHTEPQKSKVPSPLHEVKDSSSILNTRIGGQSVSTPLLQAQLSSGPLLSRKGPYSKPDVHFPLDLSSCRNSPKCQQISSDQEALISVPQSDSSSEHQLYSISSESSTSKCTPSQLISSTSSHSLQKNGSRPASFESAPLCSSQDLLTTSSKVIDTASPHTSSQTSSSTTRNRRKGKAVKLERLQYAFEDKCSSEELMEYDTEDYKLPVTEAPQESVSRKSVDSVDVISVPTYKPSTSVDSSTSHQIIPNATKVSEAKPPSQIGPVRPIPKINVSAEATRIARPVPQPVPFNPLELSRMGNQTMPFPYQVSSLFFGHNGLNTTHNGNVITSYDHFSGFPYHDFSGANVMREGPICPPPKLALPLKQNGANANDRPSSKSEEEKAKWQDAYACSYCDMAFKDCIMYTMHMGYHGYQDPFTCNMCGQQNKDKVSFFLHIARSPHH
ncbi:uncharacterized protein LOC143246693 [Tachypleus tridentatus]|uniref:uncharacterized protein LOC143246693 n=1 Tax=Tachypleus tridentatus TaxID=6853 RepID=UPI003FD342ED